jgi:hypothetical protein
LEQEHHREWPAVRPQVAAQQSTQHR